MALSEDESRVMLDAIESVRTDVDDGETCDKHGNDHFFGPGLVAICWCCTAGELARKLAAEQDGD